MKKFFRKLCSFFLVVVVLIQLLPTIALAESWPSLSSTSYCEFVAAKTFNAYRDSKLTTRGTASPARSYGAAVYKGDVCKIYQITSSFVKLAYPTSSGYKTAYAKRSDVFSVLSPQSVSTARGQVTTYKTAGGAYYGYTESGDKCYKVGTSGNYTAIIYNARSGNRTYKLGYVKTSQYASTIAPKSASGTAATVTMSSAKPSSTNCSTYTKTVQINPSTFADWVTKIKSAESNLIGTNVLCASGKTKEYNGVVIIGRDVLSYKEVRATIPSSEIGPMIDSTKTVSVKVPTQIKYTLHKHSVTNRINSRFWGTLVVGLVEGEVRWIQQCDCGLSQTLTWVIPDVTVEKYTGQDLYVKTEAKYFYH